MLRQRRTPRPGRPLPRFWAGDCTTCAGRGTATPLTLQTSAYRSGRYWECKPCAADYVRPYQLASEARNKGAAMLRNARKRAQAQGLVCDLTEADCVAMLPRLCPAFATPILWGQPPAPGLRSSRSGASPSLDRLHPAKGYTLANCRVISDAANKLKSGWTPEELAARAAKAPGSQWEKLRHYVTRALAVESTIAALESRYGVQACTQAAALLRAKERGEPHPNAG